MLFYPLYYTTKVIQQIVLFSQKPPFTSGSQRVNPLLIRLYHIWLLVSAPLKNISQWEGLSHILWNIKMFETTNQILISYYSSIRNYPQ